MRVCWGLLLPVLFAGSAVVSEEPPLRPPGDARALGQRLFQRQCARCHGMKGEGGGGPSLTRSRLRHAPGEKALLAVIRQGIPGTEMEPAWQLNDRELAQVAAYVRSLGQTEPATLPGNPATGKTLFDQGDCTKCHTVRGQGGGLGPDLTEVGARRGPAYLRQALHEPGASPSLDADGYRAFLPVQVATQDGRIVRGLRINEDTFTIQIRDGENHFHSFQKRDLAEVKREEAASLMPSYSTALSPTALDDLVAYLASLRGEP